MRRGRIVRVLCTPAAGRRRRRGVVRVPRECRARRRAPVLACGRTRGGRAREERRRQCRELHPRPAHSHTQSATTAAETQAGRDARGGRRARARPAARRVAPRAVRDLRGEQLGLRPALPCAADRRRPRQRPRAAALLLRRHAREGHRPARVRTGADARAHARTRARRVETRALRVVEGREAPGAGRAPEAGGARGLVRRICRAVVRVQRLEAWRVRVVLLLLLAVMAGRGLVPPQVRTRERRRVRGVVRAERVLVARPCAAVRVAIRRRRRVRARARRARVVRRVVRLPARRRVQRAREDLRVVMLLLLVRVLLLGVVVLQVVRLRAQGRRLRCQAAVPMVTVSLARVGAQAQGARERGNVHGRLAAELGAPSVVVMLLPAALPAARARTREPRAAAHRAAVCASFPARVVRSPAVHVVRVLRVEVVLQLLRLVEVELLLVLLSFVDFEFRVFLKSSHESKDQKERIREEKSQTKERRESQYIVQSINDAKSHLRTMGIEFHSLLRILLISPVRIIWFAAETCGLRLRAKIMNAFIGRLGVPSELSDCVVRAWCMSFFFYTNASVPFHSEN